MYRVPGTGDARPTGVAASPHVTSALPNPKQASNRHNQTTSSAPASVHSTTKPADEIESLMKEFFMFSPGKKEDMLKAIMKSSYKEKGTSMEDLEKKCAEEVMVILVNIILKIRDDLDVMRVENDQMQEALKSKKPSEGSTASSEKEIMGSSYKKKNLRNKSFEEVITILEEEVGKIKVTMDELRKLIITN